MTNPSLPALTGQATLDVAPFRKGARDALNAVREVTDFAKKHGTMTLTTKLAGTSASAMRAQLTAALGGQVLPVSISFNPGSISAALASLHSQLNAVVGLNLSSLTAVQAQINTQISQLTALIAQLRSLGGGGGSGAAGPGAGLSANARTLLADLEKLNNEYKRGNVSANQYATRLAGLQSALRVAAAGAQAGSAEFRQLDQAVTRTVQGLRNVETAKIVQLRTELSGARAAFDAAAASATTLAQRQAATAAYTGELNRVRVALQGMAASGRLTADQLGNVNRLLAQTAREANTINGRINVAGLSGNISNALQQLTGFVPGLAQVTGLFGDMSPAIMGTTVALGAFAAGLATSFRTAAEFQQGMADIRALTQPTAQGLNDLREAGMNLGQPLGVGARKAAAAMLELNRAGLSAADVVGGGLVGALNLAGAAGISAAEGGKLAVAAMTAFKLSAQDMPAIADTFANFSNKTFLGAEDLSQAIASVGPVARSAGLDLNQFSGYMATLAQGGFKQMSDAGTSLKTMLLSLQSPSSTAASAMEEIGLNVYDAAGNMRPLADVLEDLRGKLKGLTEQQRNAALKDIFGQDAIRAATILLDESADAIQKNIDAMGLQGEAARVARERMDTYNGAVQQLGASWERFQITVGDKLLPVMTGLVRGLTAGVDTLQRFANGSENLLPYIAPLVGAFVALRGAAIAAAAPAIWAALLTAIGGFFTTVNVWIASNPLGAIALGVSALAAAVNKIMQDTASTYDQIDADQQASSEALIKRVRELRQEGTEVARVQAQVLLALDDLQKAQMGELKGTNFWGERIYEVDPAKVKAAQDNLDRLRANLIAVRTEAQRHSGIKTELGGPGLSPEQAKKRQEAIEKLRASIEDRAFTLRVEGMSDLDAALAQLDREFKKLREEVQKPFAGNLNNSVLLEELADLQRQQQAEAAAIRKQFALQAVEDARTFALGAQRAELDAMREGAEKRAALREREIQDVQREVSEKAVALADFPKQQREVEEAGRQQVAAMRRGWAEEDLRLAEENAQRVLDAERSARDAVVSAMEDGLQKEAALRAVALIDLEADIAQRVAALEGYPEAQIRVEAAGRQEVEALRDSWHREDQRRAEEAARTVEGIERSARDASLAAMRDGVEKEALLRAVALADLRENLGEQIAELEGFPAEQQRVQEAGRVQIAALYDQWAQEDQRRAEEVSRTLQDAARAARDAEVANIQDAGQRRAAQRRLDLDDLRQSIQDRVDELEGYPEAQRQIEEDGHREIAAMREGWRQEDERLAREAARRLAQAWEAVADAEAQALAAARGVEAAQFELDLSRRLAALRGNVVASAELEAQAVRDRARLAEEAAQEQGRLDRERLARERDQRLSADDLSAGERRAVWAQYYADLDALGGREQSAALGRLAAQEEAERQAAERIRQARLQAALDPAEEAGRDVAALGRSQQLAESAAERLALQVKVTAAREREAAAVASVLAQADQLGLTEAERRDLADRLAQSQHEVTLSQREQVKLQDQITGEAEELVNLYGQIVRLTGSETGVAAAQRELAGATEDLGDAYQRAVPFLQQFREGSLKPEDFTEAKDALGGLITALEAQRQKLEQLRGEYTRQRDALQSVQDVLKSFGQEFGDENLLNNAISFNQTTYDQARDALRTLLLGGQYDAAQLAEATRNLQQSYGGLKDSVVALGEARAREHERERDRIKRESDARLRTLDAQIEAAKKAGLDTTALERERDTIVRETELRVTQLEGRAEAARKAAQDALSDRTKGLQELLRGVSGGAAAAGSQVDALGRQVQQSERDVQSSAEQMKKSLEGAFKGVPAQAGKAGADAGRQFMAQLQRQLKAVRLPGITTPGAPTLPATRPAVTNNNITITVNGQNVTGTNNPTMRQLLLALANEADRECRRRNS
ncbi:phage tail tape measure protein [Deinococcus sp. NW-56]|uniref:phage tail tape measure protein n=1 Tax=Deinococcus sp. NW-56 TaxID=2080419 RepID=UPI000CF38DE6|nr:phage tail tape measure protein [Deinococcus sp. NW-56]